MVKEFGSDEPSEPLNGEIEKSRQRLVRDVRALRYELDIPAKIRRSFQQQTTAWVVGAVAVGAVVMVLPRLRRTVYVETASGEKRKSKILETGFLLGALRIAVPFLKPFVFNFIRNKMAGGMGGFSRSSGKS